MTRSGTWLSLCLLIPSLAAGAERWTEMSLAGQPAGYAREETTHNGRTITTVESRFVINRLGSKVELNAKTREEEDGGALAALAAEISSSAQSTLIEGRVDSNTLALSISTGGKTYHRSIALTEPLLGPERARQLTLERLRAAGDRISYAVFSAELGVVTTVTRKCLSRGNEGLEVEETISSLPGATSLWLDENGYLKRRSQTSPFGLVEIRAAPRERALAAAVGAQLPPDVYKSSLVRSNIRLPGERRIERLRVRIRHHKPELGWPDFEDDRQRVITRTKDTVELEIQQRPGIRRPPPEAAYKAPNALFQSDDPTVAAIAREVTTAKPGIFALRDWTSSHMRFDPGIAIAPASEVIRNRAGTCFGYSVLLGALARASGIPSRMKMGFVYTRGAWGGHAWIEAYTNGEWVAVDGALVSPGPADAARISFFSSSLEEGTIAGLGSLARMYGNVGIEILSYTIDGKTVSVPDGSPSFSVVGDVYENPWLSLKIRKPSHYRYTQLDAIWPHRGIVVLRGEAGEVVTVDRVSGSPEKYVDGRAALILPAGGDNWILTVQAPNAKELLRQAAGWMEIRPEN